MTILITDRDQKILRYMEEYKYGTIEQLKKVFCTHQDSGYNIIRRRMTEIHKCDYIKIERDKNTNKLIYVWNEKKLNLPTRHRMLVLDVMANLYVLGAEIQQFDIEKMWMDGKIRSDAFTVFTANGNSNKHRYQYFVEVHLSNNPHNLEKYDSLYESGEVQTYLGRNTYPRVLLVTDRRFNINLKYTKVVTFNTRLDGFLGISLD